MEDKKQIRKQMLALRNAMTHDEVVQKSEAIVQKVLQTNEYKEAQNILLYADYCHEVMTRALFEDALLHKKKVYFPKSDGLTNTMEFYQVVSVKQLFEGYKGIREPKEDAGKRFVWNPCEDTLAIIPGVAFDTRGYRVGYGKGFYDKYFSNKRPITMMALAFANQITEEGIPTDEHDIKMDKVITEEIIYSFLRI
ncbi:MAG: 5-formyltetrahydrofolate cyclo-ligase [Lachnospiraceae bacterium]|nr:5-formyltetrahydrofolate cyclo-ligase [Lachnospiraceae bacterium]